MFAECVRVIQGVFPQILKTIAGILSVSGKACGGNTVVVRIEVVTGRSTVADTKISLEYQAFERVDLQ